MTVSSEPTATLSNLHRADGSATFSQNGYTVIASVNGPIEVQRRDELPEEAAIDVIVRPSSGVGGTRERHLESILESTLRQIILIQDFPRTLIQVTLQITGSPENETSRTKLNQASSNLPILPALLQTSVLALLSAAIPLATTVTSTLLATSSVSPIVQQNPIMAEIREASSVHVLAFSAHHKLLLAESEGSFSIEQWEAVCDKAEDICCGSSIEEADQMQDIDDSGAGASMKDFVTSTMQEKVALDLHWKE